ncbi:helicase-like [Candidatus Vecturithrix granuli]|uniref:Helicase-like n=1 Tax=Vecturithrix granuli TaxID=1499967 RepID=A0A081C0C1_VECG1|nr:helicase-like [Candidatus Vecturithrix granuli]
MTTIHKPGRLVTYRDREWMVLPSDNPDILLLKPLGGAEAEITGVYLPLHILPGEEISEAQFPLPSASDLGAYETAKLLFDAARLSFRNASGPFRCMGKLSFRPRAYQMVPLTMALKQDIVRLLIADDVGIGKTVEALVILKELLERGDITRFAVICPPHLCDQWQQELRDKLDIAAEIIRSSTAAALDRKLTDDRSVFYSMPYQVISIDYIKADKRRGIFLSDCPEFVIVDEVHTCALPAGATSKSQQQRHALLYDLAERAPRHLVLLTATPHSGKDLEFISLLGLLNPGFRMYDFAAITQTQRRQIARHFIQRKREQIRRWMREETPFPARESKEIGYTLMPTYREFYDRVLRFARGISQTGTRRNTARVRYWAALALLRGVMSSPAAGAEMLHNRQRKLLDAEELQDFQQQPNPVFDTLEMGGDDSPLDLIETTDLNQDEQAELAALSATIQTLSGVEQDAKAAVAVKLVAQWLTEGYQPIIFCKYIATAKYLGELLKQECESSAFAPECQSSALARDTRKQSFRTPVDIQVITSELADEQRKEQIEAMGRSDRRVLVATDCLSEGINLQDHFTAVLHYDLPWNPNRIEQRDGRVDRFGQTAPTVKSYLLWGEDNPIDTIVLQILIKKVRDIQRATGVSIPLGEDRQSIMDEVLQEVLLKDQSRGQQMQLFAETQISNELETARQKAENLRSIFAHEAIKPDMIEQDLREVDEAIGDVATVEHFVVNAVQHLSATIQECESSAFASALSRAKAELSHSDAHSDVRAKAELSHSGYKLFPQNLPPHLRAHFDGQQQVFISFESPTPKGYRYIGRNHQFVEQLCQFLLAIAFEGHPDYHRLARVAEIQTDAVSVKTVLIMFRVRNVIKEAASAREVIAEEMYLWGYAGSGANARTLDYQEAKRLLLEARSLTNLSPERQQADLERELEQFKTLEPTFLKLAEQRAEHLVEAHGRFKELVGGRRYEKAVPVLPPDVLGVYILTPKPKLL